MCAAVLSDEMSDVGRTCEKSDVTTPHWPLSLHGLPRCLYSSLTSLCLSPDATCKESMSASAFLTLAVVVFSHRFT